MNWISDMPRSRMTKIDIEARVLKLKSEFCNDAYNNHNEDWLKGANYSLNKILDTLQEYSS